MTTRSLLKADVLNFGQPIWCEVDAFSSFCTEVIYRMAVLVSFVWASEPLDVFFMVSRVLPLPISSDMNEWVQQKCTSWVPPAGPSS